MKLGFDINFDDLSSLNGLRKLDKYFLEWVKNSDQELYQLIQSQRQSWIHENTRYNIKQSNLLLDLAPLLDQFIAKLFDIENETLLLQSAQEKLGATYECKRKFTQRIDYNYFSKEYIDSLNISKVKHDLVSCLKDNTDSNQLTDILAHNILKWIENKEHYSKELYLASCYFAYMVHNNSPHALFDIPRPIDPDNHIRESRINKLTHDAYLGFDYRDKEINLDQAVHHAKYCIYCHKKQKDSCAKGMLYAKSNKALSTTQEKLKGCPLEQKISEMNMAFAQGLSIGALSIIMIDNPMVALTGHRVCNDCMKACIFQKQDPVNVPLIESQIFENVINLPYGPEIYILLSKWNPLNLKSYLPAPKSDKNILVAGMGPAGITLSYYLLQDGHIVTGIEKTPITPLNFDISQPIKSWKQLKEPLHARKPKGFGGISEIGITNRWDKNNLLLARLILERRENFTLIGNTKIETMLDNDLYDHIALCIGSGKPKQLYANNRIPKGVICGANFLTKLQNHIPYHASGDINILQIRLPAIVIGCGLSAVDSAVELLHYYVIQVEKFAKNYNKSCLQSKEQQEIAEEFLRDHAIIATAKNDQEKIKLLQKLGGVTICYRNNIKNSPAYKINHEEIEHAMSVGIKFKENIDLDDFIYDQYNHIKASRFRNIKDESEIINSKTVIIAFGTESQEFQNIKHVFDNDLSSDIFKTHSKKVSYFGDCNPQFAGSTVGVIANVKKHYKAICKEDE